MKNKKVKIGKIADRYNAYIYKGKESSIPTIPTRQKESFNPASHYHPERVAEGEGKELNPDDVFRSIQYWKKWNKAALNIIKPNKKSHKKTRRK